MRTSVVGNLGRVVMARLAPSDDVLAALIDLAEAHSIRTGIIVDLTGSLEIPTVQHFPVVADPDTAKVEVIEVPGPLEVSGHGIIGRNIGSGGVTKYEDGKPYVHCHICITSAEHTLCGHLLEGTRVRSPHQLSHFIVTLAEITGVELDNVVTGPAIGHMERRVWTSEHGYVYNELRQAGPPSL